MYWDAFNLYWRKRTSLSRWMSGCTPGYESTSKHWKLFTDVTYNIYGKQALKWSVTTFTANEHWSDPLITTFTVLQTSTEVIHYSQHVLQTSTEVIHLFGGSCRSEVFLCICKWGFVKRRRHHTHYIWKIVIYISVMISVIRLRVGFALTKVVRAF